MPDPVEIFISYSHNDTKLMRELLASLQALRHQGLIREWHDRQLQPGDEWAGKIDAHLESADIILLLISKDFIASGYCFDIEMKRAMERHELGEARVVPIILRECDFNNLRFAKLQSLPTTPAGRLKPVRDWRDRDHAYTVIAQSIRDIINNPGGQTVAEQTEETYEPPEPLLLAHLCNRRVEKKELRKVFDEQRNARAGGQMLTPVVCVAHGSPDESLVGFKERLEKHDLYEIADLDKSRPIKKINLRWPLDPDERADPQTYLLEALAQEVTRNRKAPIEEVLQILIPHRAVMICTDLSSERWDQSASPQLVTEYFKFWNSFPRFQSGVIFGGLFLTYKQFEGSNPQVRQIFETRNQQARDFLTRFKSDLEGEHALRLAGRQHELTYPNLRGVVLTELPPVPQDEVELWLSSAELFRDFCRRCRTGLCSTATIQIQEKIADLYESEEAVFWPQQQVMAVPMALLAGKLSKLLAAHRCEN